MSKLKKAWNFIWHSNSIWSWIINIILAYLIVKFLIYPGLGLILGTTHPVVAVVSNSMQHDQGFEEWWNENKEWYLSHNIKEEDFKNFAMKDGFSKGDIIVLKSAKDISIGDIIVFEGNSNNPIIHRATSLEPLQTKGDNNPNQFPSLGETNINRGEVIGKAVFKIPLLGWVKIGFTNLIN